MPTRSLMFAVLLALTALPRHGPATASPAIAQATDPAPEVVIAPEVKLRKLHLVRPDLIPFPIFFETYA